MMTLLKNKSIINIMQIKTFSTDLKKKKKYQKKKNLFQKL